MIKKAVGKMEIEKYKAGNLLALVKWHRETCKVDDCGINLYLVLEDFERHLGRKATQDESVNFI